MNTTLISLLCKIVFFSYIAAIIMILFLIKKGISIKKKLIFLFILHITGFIITIGFTHITMQANLRAIKKRNFYKISNITSIKNQEGTTIGIIGKENREYEYLKNIPPIILQTIISVEDESFFANYGVSVKNTIFNIFKALFTNKKVFGASTITQQLARNLFLSNKKSILRKIKEIYISFYLSYYLNKEEILEIYVNHIYFGDSTYGIKTAAKHFFNKDLISLNIEEIAYLSAVINGPSYFCKNYGAAMDRKDYVLTRMFKTKIITEEQFIIAKQEPIIFHKTHISNINKNYGYIIEDIKEELKAKNLQVEEGLIVHTTIDDKLQEVATGSLQRVLELCEKKIPWRGPLMNDANGNLSQFKSMESKNIKVVYLYKDGRIVGNNFKDKLNEKNLIENSFLIRNKCIVLVEKISNEWYLKNSPQLNGAVLIVDPNTGKILSMVGGRGFSYSFLNGVTQMKKSPGSICKILPCITAFEQNFPVDYPLEDRPIYVDANNNINYINEDEISDYMEIKNIKVIRNHDKKYIGPTTIKTAFEKSRNVPMIILTKLVGINNVKNTAVNMGIISEDTPFYLSGSLGSIYVNIYSMVKGLSMLANGGNKIPNLYYIHKITDLKGNLVYENPEINPINNSEEKVLKNKTINNINNLCEGVIRNGIRNKLDCISKKIAGKTGTSQENKEAAFVVWSKNYLIYVMVYNMDHENPAYKLWGNDIPLEISKNILIYLEESLEETIKLQE